LSLWFFFVADFVPAVLDRSLVDKWVKTNDADSFRVARQLIREEGLLCGGSTGANVWAALKIAKELGPECRRIVVVAPDGIRNYMFVGGKEGRLN
jgi:cystathionine beta-synthase